MTRIAVAGLLAALALSCDQPPAPPALPAPDPVLARTPRGPSFPRPPLEVTLRATPDPRRRAPWIDVLLRNQAGVPLTVVEPLDGAAYGWRPGVRVRLRDAAGRDVDLLPARCGVTTPLRPEDFQWLQPGEAMKVGEFVLGAGTSPPAGRYTLEAAYDTTGPVGSWVGIEIEGVVTPALLDLIERVPKGRFASGTLAVDVGP